MNAATARVAAGTPDPSDCGREPIHIPGLIQPFGALMAFDGPGVAARFVSRNLRVVLGRDWPDALGRSVEELFGPGRGAELRRALADPAIEANPTALGMIPGRDGRPDQAIGHAHGERIILELDSSTPEGLPPFRGLHPEARAFLRYLGLVRTVDDLARLAAVELRRITGFDRVLVYRFDRDQHGTVVAEDRNDALRPTSATASRPGTSRPRPATSTD
jgi:chemotaxis family two-component system sensor kinase Cph1